MQAWLRSVVDAILGKLPGKTGRLDTATRMAMDADFSDRHEPVPQPRWRKRDDQHLFKSAAPLPVDPLDELIRVVNETQERDAEDERRLYHPTRRSALVFSTEVPCSPAMIFERGSGSRTCWN